MTFKSSEFKGAHRCPEEALVGLEEIPVARLRKEIREEIRNHPDFVLIGETGSGKTTCLPPLLLELRDELGLKGSIAVTQPRRVATRSVAARVSEMMNCEVSERVGYHIRFEDQTTEGTDITFMTDGILLRKIQFDPFLLDYSIVMIDEAHERSLNMDLCLGLLKDVNARRRDAGIEPVRIVVTSATIERGKFADFINQTDRENSIQIEGKMFPVEVFYEDYDRPNYDFTLGAANKVHEIISSGIPGDILIFMPGKKEIEATIENIREMVGTNEAEIMPLHSELSPDDQDRIFLDFPKRKIIVSTNVAETSVTIDGIIHVIDSGLVKQTEFNPHTGIEQLVLTYHALSGLEQRKGRAGRTAPGYCYRLFSEESLRRRSRFQTPEIQRSDLAHVVLAMKKVGIENVENFDFIDPPDGSSISQAVKTLEILGALDDQGRLTEVGQVLTELGLEPRLGRMVIEAAMRDCVNEICIIAAFLGGKRIFSRPTDSEIDADHAHDRFRDRESDFITYLNIWNKYVASGYSDEWAKNNYLNERALEEVKNVRLDLIDVLARHNIEVQDGARVKINRDQIGKSIAAGFITNLIEQSGKFTYRKLDGTKNEIFIHPSSTMFSRNSGSALIISGDIFINPLGKAYASDCMPIKPAWIVEIAPWLTKVRYARHAKYNKKLRRKVTEASYFLKGSKNNLFLGSVDETS